uniref:Ankyrin repeat protein n=1 Tax=Trichogramma kaykai TaxID=54128 RepID=A0ABD2XPE1_9HYME
MSDDESDHHGQLSLAKLKNLRENVNWEIRENRLLVKFLIHDGYQDEPDVDKDGKPLLHRTTPLHIGISSYFARALFELYDRFHVNYSDESGFSYFHAAKYGCDQVVQKYLKLRQDPNCVVTATGNLPLHFALRFNNEEVFELLMRGGADPNLVNAKGLTPLHMIANKLDDDNAVDFFFKTCDKKNHLVPIDPLDNRGRTPLSKPWPETRWDDYRLILASGALGVVEHLEKRGYQMERSDAMTIMKFFVKYKVFEKSANIEKCFNDEEFAKEAKERTTWIYPRMWLADE